MIGLEVVGWLLTLIAIGFSIGMHEVGHLLPAKRFGVRVPQYMVGFGPTLWSRRKGETEYGLKAIPLGGYIRMIGMYPPEPGSDGTTLRASSTGRFSTMVSDARATSMQEVLPTDGDRVFYKLPVRKRVVIMLGGPFMNLLLAFVFFAIAFCVIGVPQSSPNTTVYHVTQCMPAPNGAAVAAGSDGSCQYGPSPAKAAGLQEGDVITVVDGTPVTTWTQAQDAIKAAGAGPATIGVTRDGAPLVLSADLRTITSGGETKAFLGMQPDSIPYSERQSLTELPGTVWNAATSSAYAVVTLPWRLYDLVQNLASDQPRDPNGLISVVGAGRANGDVVASTEYSFGAKAFLMVSIIASINLAVFLFNLIPLLPLDGGHVIGAVWEAVRRRLARLRGRPDPGPVDVAKALPLAYGVFVVLLLMGALLIYADLVKPIQIT